MTKVNKQRKINLKCAGRKAGVSLSLHASKLTLHVGAFVMTFAMLFTTLWTPCSFVFAEDGNGNGNGNGIVPFTATQDTTLRAADNETVDTYESFLLNATSARYAGRIWTDKSVYALDKDNLSRTVNVGGTSVNFGEDFLEVFSAMGSSLTVNGEAPIPLDVMFILDMSTSMTEKNNGVTRLQSSINALNKAFEMVMDGNPDNRAGLVVYSGDNGFNWDKPNGRYLDDAGHTPVQSGYINAMDGVVALPLNHYDKPANNYFGFYNGQKLQYGRYVPAYVEAWNMEYTQYPLIYLGVNISGYGGTYYQALGATNTQMGLYKGMNELAIAGPATDTNVPELSKRKPVVILITDGQPTMISNLEKWWDPKDHEAGTTYAGEGTGVHYGNGLLTMATAAYMRTLISANYETTATNSLCLATIGIDMNKLSENEEKFANTTLNPAGIGEGSPRVSSGGPGNGGDIYDAFVNGYLGTSRQATIPTGANNNTGAPNPSGQYIFKHPPASLGWDLNKVDDLFYNDIFESKGIDELENVLKDILSSAMQGTMNVPIEGSGELGSANMLSYSDPIGEYMDVKNVEKLRLFGVEYDVISVNGEHYKDYTVVTAGDHQDATVINPCYGADSDKTFKLSEIKIWVEESSASIKDLKQYKLRVDVPANAVPVRTATVDLDINKEVEKYETNINDPGVEPLRLFYTVGMQDDYLLTGTRTVNLIKIDDGYKQTHRDPVTGHVNFYANYFSGEQYIYSGGADIIGADYDRGDAFTTFSPADTNRYYIYQEYLPLYTDENDPASYVRNYNDIRSADTYYFNFPYYTTAKEIQKVQIERLGSMFGSGILGDSGFGAYLVWYDPDTGNAKDFDEIRPGDNYIVATKKGGIRVGNMDDHSEDSFKGDGNVTETSTTYYLPTVSDKTTQDGDVVLTSYLGNNGVLSVSDAEIMLTKEVVYDPKQVTEDMINELKRDEKFLYKIELPGVVYNGKLTAIEVTRNEDSAGCGWRARINKIELVPNKQGLLVSSTGKLATIYDGSNNEYYLYIGETEPVEVFKFDDENGGLDETSRRLSYDNVRLLPKSAYSTSGPVDEGNLLQDATTLDVGFVDFTGLVGAEVSSDFKVKTTYQTREIEFTYNDASNSSTSDQFTLQHLTGLLFNGIGSGAYTVTETVTPDQIKKGIGLNRIKCEMYQQVYDGANGTFSLVDMGDATFNNVTDSDGKAIADTVNGEGGKFTKDFDDNANKYSVKSITSADGVDHVHYCNDYIPASLVVPKIVVGSADSSDRYTFEITLKAPQGTVFLGYYAAYIHPTGHKVKVKVDTDDGEPDSGGEAERDCEPSDHKSTSIPLELKGKDEYKFEVTNSPDSTKIILKDGEQFVILGLPAGTTYEIKEIIMNSDGDVINNYDTTIGVAGRDVADTPRFESDNAKRTSEGELNSTVHREIDLDTNMSVGHIEPIVVTYTNGRKMELPATGGSGVWVYTMTGCALLLLSVLMTVKRKHHV